MHSAIHQSARPNHELHKPKEACSEMSIKNSFDLVKKEIIILKKLGWQTIRELVDTAMMVNWSINNEAPNYLTSLFERLSQNDIGSFAIIN